MKNSVNTANISLDSNQLLSKYHPLFDANSPGTYCNWPPPSNTTYDDTI